MARLLRGMGFGLVAFSALVASAQNPAVSTDDVRKAIASFLADPLKESAKDDAKKIVTFATESSEVVVILGPEERAFLTEKTKKDYSSVLLTAFIAGNVQTQLDLGEKRNELYPGAIQVMRAYREIRKKDADFHSAAVEDLLKKHRDGTLLKHLAEIEERRESAKSKGIKQ